MKSQNLLQIKLKIHKNKENSLSFNQLKKTVSKKKQMKNIKMMTLKKRVMKQNKKEH